MVAHGQCRRILGFDGCQFDPLPTHAFDLVVVVREVLLGHLSQPPPHDEREIMEELDIGCGVQHKGFGDAVPMPHQCVVFLKHLLSDGLQIPKDGLCWTGPF